MPGQDSQEELRQEVESATEELRQAADEVERARAAEWLRLALRLFDEVSASRRAISKAG